MKFTKSKPEGRGPSSALGLLSFSDSEKSLIRFTPESVLIGALILGLIVFGIQFIW